MNRRSKIFSAIRVGVIALLAGLASGSATAMLQHSESGSEYVINAATGVQRFFSDHGWLVMTSLGLIYAFSQMIVYIQIKRIMKRKELLGNGDTDYWEERIDLLQERTSLLSNFFMPVHFSVFAWTFVASTNMTSWKMWMALAVFMIGAIFSAVVVTAMVFSAQKRDPSKKGNPLEFRFSCEWMESCDEGEKLLMYKAGYYTWYKMNIIMVAIWCIALFVSNVFDTGSGALVAVGGIWILQSCLHCYEVLKQRNCKLA